MLLRSDHCSICVINSPIFTSLLTIRSWYRLISLFTSFILSNCFSYSISCSIMSVFIISPVSIFLYVNLVCSLVKTCPIQKWIHLPCPSILDSIGKNAVVPSLPFISLNDFCNLVWGSLVC